MSGPSFFGALEYDVSTRFHQFAGQCGISPDRIAQYESQPELLARKVKKTLKNWADAACEAFASKQLVHSAALDLAAQVGGLKDWQFALAQLRGLKSPLGSTVRTNSLEQIAPTVAMMRFTSTQLVNRAAIAALESLIEKTAEVFSVSLGEARTFVADLSGIPWSVHLSATQYSEDVVPGDFSRSPEGPLYSFVVVHGHRTFGEFRRTLECLREERDLRYAIEAYLAGNWTLDSVLNTATLYVVRYPDFLFGRFWMARLLMERGAMELAAESFSDAYRAATDLMPKGFNNYLSYGAAANDVFLEGVESYLYFFARTEAYESAEAMMKKMFWYAYDDNDFRTQYLGAILKLLAGRDDRALQSAGFAGLNSALGTADLLRAIVMAANQRWVAAAEEIVSALTKLPLLTFVMTHGITDKDPCLPRNWFTLLMERRPDLKRVMTRALEHPDIRASFDRPTSAADRTLLVSSLAEAMEAEGDESQSAHGQISEQDVAS